MRTLLLCVFCFMQLGGITALVSGEESGMERVLTNAHVSVWIPSRTATIRDDRVSDVGIYENTSPGARFISGAAFHEYRIDASITAMTEQDFKNLCAFSKMMK